MTRFSAILAAVAALVSLASSPVRSSEIDRLLAFKDICAEIIVRRSVPDQAGLTQIDTHKEHVLYQSGEDDIRLIVGPAGANGFGCIVYLDGPPTDAERAALLAEFVAWAEAQKGSDAYYVGTCAGPCVVDVGLEMCASDGAPIRLDATYPGRFGRFGIDFSRNARNEFWFKTC